MSSFDKLFSKYKTYDDSNGRGSIEEWGRLFNEKMNSSDAMKIMKRDNPLEILGLTKMPDIDELKNVYRKLVMQHHPDKGGDPILCKKIIAAYTILEMQLQ
jgi:DnaJ-domain-containing protein 1